MFTHYPRLETTSPQVLQPLPLARERGQGSGGVVIVIVMLAELEGGGSSVARVGESPTSSSAKITARSEAKHRKRSFCIVS